MILGGISLVISIWALIRTYRSGKIKGNEIKNEKGETIYKVQD